MKTIICCHRTNFRSLTQTQTLSVNKALFISVNFSFQKMNLLRIVTKNFGTPGRLLLGTERQLVTLSSSSSQTPCRNYGITSQKLKLQQEKLCLPNFFICNGYKTLCSIITRQPDPMIPTLSVTGSNTSRFLAPSQVFSIQTCEYKVRRKLRKRCPHCYFEKRQGRWYIECKVKPRHKQMKQMPAYKLFRED